MLASGDLKNRESRSLHERDRVNPKTRALILRSGALGDTLMLLPSLVALQGQAEIFLAGRRPGIEFLRPYVSGCLDYEGSGWHQLFTETPEALDRPPWPSVDLVAAFSAGPINRLQHNLKFFFPMSEIHLFPVFPKPDLNLHVALYLAQCLAKAGLPLIPEQAVERAWQKPLLDHMGRKVKTRGVIFHPGSGSTQKNLTPEFWLNLMKTLRSISGRPEAILLLGPAEETLLPYFKERQKEHGAKIVFNPEKAALIRILKTAALYIGHDSGITHLAALLGQPCIALFKNSSVTQWHPLGPAVTVIEAHEPLDAVMARTLRAVRSFLREGSKTEKNFQPQT